MLVYELISKCLSWTSLRFMFIVIAWDFTVTGIEEHIVSTNRNSFIINYFREQLLFKMSLNRTERVLNLKIFSIFIEM